MLWETAALIVKAGCSAWGVRWSAGGLVRVRTNKFIQGMNRKFDKSNCDKCASVTPLYTRARLSFRLMEEGAERCPGRPREREKANRQKGE